MYLNSSFPKPLLTKEGKLFLLPIKHIKIQAVVVSVFVLPPTPTQPGLFT